MSFKIGRINLPSLSRSYWRVLNLHCRNTHIVKHAKILPPTPAGRFQRLPDEKQELQMYDFVEDSVNEYPPVKVILLKSVDGFGRKGDVVTVSSEEFHNNLFPIGAAIYATPYDLHLLEQRKLAGEFAQLDAEDMVRHELKKVARVLNGTLVNISMAFDEEWTLERWHLRVNLKRAGFVVPDESIVLPAERITGPNKNLQGKLITFYVKHTPHCIIPVLGRIDQISSKGRKLIGATSMDGLSDQKPEDTAPPIHYSVEPLNLSDKEIHALMALNKGEPAMA